MSRHIGEVRTLRRRWAKIRTQFRGVHRYPGAPLEVGYLASLHRHMFNVIVAIQQFHNERDIEYIMFQGEVDELIKHMGLAHTPTDSCESMAQRLGTAILERYPERDLVVEVNEDGENGAVVEWV